MAVFNFVKLPTDDLEAQLAFYAQAFGFVRHADFDSAELAEILLRQEATDFLLVLMRFKQGAPAAAATTIGTLGFVSTDIDGDLARALDAGATLKQSVFVAQGTKIALVEDPEGHEIELVQFG